jgi:coenzyme F420-0:L-glutamate ligase/coenzyme F420-1:gamma-L-glutamate ligase
MKLEFLPVFGIPEISPGLQLGTVLRECIVHSGIQLAKGDIVVIAQKIVSKAEGRVICLADVVPSRKAALLAAQMHKDPRLIEVILLESRRIVRVRGDILICETHHGFICANAGVDRSNVDGGSNVTLLPKKPDASAQRLAAELACGVIITDTFGRPWREGLMDAAIGVAGAPAYVDYRGQNDAHGYPLQATILATADALAAAAGVVMGKNNQTPAVVVRGFDAIAKNGTAAQLLRSAETDLFL